MQNIYIKKYEDKNFSFFNTGSSEKKVVIPWKQFQDRKPTRQEIDYWSTLRTQNYAIVCGEISNLIVFDVDTKNGGDPTPFQNLGMYEVRTPSGGYHFYVQYDELLKSTKHLKKPTNGILFGVDVQSNGSLVFACPSAFPQGSYSVLNDVPIGKCPNDLLIRVVEAIEPETEAKQYSPYIGPKNPIEGRPGDIFNALASWDDVLIPFGWIKIGSGSENGIQYWRRPGKKDGISASTDWKGYGLFFAFSTSVNDISTVKGYTKFSLLVALKYNGDFRAAAKDLVVENYKRVTALV
jgi:hypothetical protein